MAQCKILQDYVVYVDKVRTYGKEMSLEEAVERAINECIEDNVLADFLRNHKSEAMHMSIYEYDEEKHMKQVFEEGRQAGEKEGERIGEARGIKEGEARMASLIAALLRDNRQEDLVRITKEKDYLEKLYEEYQL